MKLQLRPPRATMAGAAPAATARRQGGIALLVVLILVLLVTLAGIAAVRTLVVEERLASNSLDRNLAMQSAERVLREAEDIALAQSLASPYNAGFPSGKDSNGAVDASLVNGAYTGSACTSDVAACTNGLCPTPAPSCTARWEDAAFDGWETVTVNATAAAAAASAATGADATLASGTTQQYIVEFLGKGFVCEPNNPEDLKNCGQYRITVRTNSGTDRAFVQLQSYYLAQAN
jgi:type IV pilus assembly protein PilX